MQEVTALCCDKLSLGHEGRSNSDCYKTSRFCYQIRDEIGRARNISRQRYKQRKQMMVSVAAVVVIGLALFAQGIMDVHTDMHNKYVLL